jgi:hypothetical protein
MRAALSFVGDQGILNTPRGQRSVDGSGQLFGFREQRWYLARADRIVRRRALAGDTLILISSRFGTARGRDRSDLQRTGLAMPHILAILRVEIAIAEAATHWPVNGPKGINK